MTEKLQQVINQCKAVSHLAAALKQIYDDYAMLLSQGEIEFSADMVGERTSIYMETIGNWLDDLDAVTEEDAWLQPIFEEARKLFPIEIITPIDR